MVLDLRCGPLCSTGVVGRGCLVQAGSETPSCTLMHLLTGRAIQHSQDDVSVLGVRYIVDDDRQCIELAPV